MFQSQDSIPLSDNLWEELIRGERTALKKLYQQYAQTLHNYGRHLTPDAALVQDCIHDLFVELWNYRKNLSPTTAIKPYLYKALRRKIVLESQKISRQSKNPELIGERIEPLYLASDNELEGYHEQRRVRMRKAIDKLPKRQQEVINLIFFENLSREEVAEIMQIDTRTVYSLTWRAVKVLRKDLLMLHPTFIIALLLLSI